MGDSEDQVIWSRGAQTTITTVGILLTTMLGLMWIMHVPRRYYFHYLEIQVIILFSLNHNLGTIL